uniref:Uncharacterized protein n=1 Tax=Siphoviridae sp. ct0Wl9 TaxID=2827763 RepID=A0A8S5TAE6_9CAUD|nr:MAG TPA: hypothetical protein [Siphoviridae sp. ct0Wl9]
MRPYFFKICATGLPNPIYFYHTNLIRVATFGAW